MTSREIFARGQVCGLGLCVVVINLAALVDGPPVVLPVWRYILGAALGVAFFVWSFYVPRDA